MAVRGVKKERRLGVATAIAELPETTAAPVDVSAAAAA
jgi:hypothetical protein